MSTSWQKAIWRYLLDKTLIPWNFNTYNSILWLRDLPSQPPLVFHQGVISTPKHKIFGKMTPSCILRDFLYLFESTNISKVSLIEDNRYIKWQRSTFCFAKSIYKVAMIIIVNWVTNFRPPKFHKFSLWPPVSKSWVTPCFDYPTCTMMQGRVTTFNQIFLRLLLCYQVLPYGSDCPCTIFSKGWIDCFWNDHMV